MNHEDWIEELKAQLESHPDAEIVINLFGKRLTVSHVSFVFDSNKETILVELED